MSDYEIEDGIELPGSYASKHKSFWEALGKLKVSQSFFAPTDEIDTSVLNTLISRQKAKSLNRFTTRAETKDGVKGRRVWRVE